MKAIRFICIILCCIATFAHAADGERQYGPVRANETLYRIALATRPPGITAAQMMMAIFRKNPQAFYQRNINRLKVGSVLTIPAPAAIARLDPKVAYSEAAKQIDAYEKDVREPRSQPGEPARLGEAQEDPNLPTGVTVTIGVTTPSDEEIEDIKQGLADDAPLVLPEPRAVNQKTRAEEPAAFVYSYDLAYLHDDNPRLARDEVDIREDNIVSGTLKANKGLSLDKFSLLNYGGSVSYEKFETFEGLDNVGFEVNTRYRFALSSSFTSSIYSLKASLGGLEFVDSEMRDSTLLNLSAELNKWLTTTINMTAGLGYRQRDSVSEVYDLSDIRAFVNFDTNFSRTDLVYTTFTFITGDTVSSATPTLDIINAADAIEPDDAFGGVDANQFAYRFDSDTAVITIGYNKIMTADLSLDISARFVNSKARADDSIYYDRTLFRASLLGRF